MLKGHLRNEVSYDIMFLSYVTFIDSSMRVWVKDVGLKTKDLTPLTLNLLKLRNAHVWY